MKRITKKARLEAARSVIDRNGFDVPFSPEDLAELSEATATDVRFAVKRRNPEFPADTRHLHVIAYDWTAPCQWSWRKAIEIDIGRTPEESAAARRHVNEQRALRYCIREDLRDFLGSQDDPKCVACGSADDLTADHAGRPFISIAREYIEAKGPVALVQRAGVGDVISDEGVEADWIAFHASRATYEVLCRPCNSRKGARGRA